MNKFATAIAACGLVSGAAMAQSNVTIYGVADAGLVYESGAAAGSVNRVSSGLASGSRLGFKGKEDLGGGLSAIFVFENGNTLDTGAAGQGGLVFGRQAFVGLAGAAGTVTLGRQYSPHYKVLRDMADPFEIGLAGTATNIIPGYTRIDNMVEYQSPNLAGFTVDLGYGMGEVAGGASKNRNLGAVVSYNAGPLSLALTSHRKENATATDHASTTMAIARYNFGGASAHVAYGVNRGTAGADNRDLLVGAIYTLGTGRVLASVILHDDRTTANRDARQWAVGYMYGLSKRTDLYAAYGSIRNENGATYTVGNATDAGTGNKALNMGIRHRF